MRKVHVIFSALAAILFSGCQNPMENPFFTVKESGLNWVEIRQYTLGTHTQRVRVRIDGNGIVTVREGTSPLVGNPFAYDISNETWADIRETRLTIPREEAVLLFQKLVDCGLFVKQEKSKDAPEDVSLFVSANIQNKTAGSSDPVSDPDLIEHLKMQVMMFYHPTPLRKR